MEEFISALHTISKNSKISVVIIRGNGPVFCAGHDIAQVHGVEG